ncbi:hypothetical protein P43SY_009226 [Pythium insidiosum]|uniref:Uncharacterized protein n=1 Tax=Pythium insidiosum TaxID=114742 RepID=A0AAD5MCQ0_PYTIN|nr:hypothetical protein P43SY_009226 [Pythium insidiosum]
MIVSRAVLGLTIAALSALSTSSVDAHSWLVKPVGRDKGPRTDIENAMACPSQQKGEVTSFRAGEKIDVRYWRNNHLGGFIRWSIVPAGNETKENFDKSVFFYTCRESGATCLPNGRNDRWSGDNSGPNTISHSNGNIGWAEPQFKSCADIRLTSSGSGNKPKCPTFVGGDRVTKVENLPSNQCFYYYNNDVMTTWYKGDNANAKSDYKFGVPAQVQRCSGGGSGGDNDTPGGNGNSTRPSIAPTTAPPESRRPSQVPAATSSAPSGPSTPAPRPNPSASPEPAPTPGKSCGRKKEKKQEEEEDEDDNAAAPRWPASPGMTQSAVILEDFEFKGHNAILNAVCYNRQHDCFVSCDDAYLRLWGMDNKHPELRSVALPPRTSAFIQAIAYVDTRQIYVAAALDGTLKLYDDVLNEIASVFTGRSVILSLVFDSKHNRLLTGGIDGCSADQSRLYAQGKHSIDVFSAVDGHHLDSFTDLFPRENGAMTAFVLHEKTQYIVCGCINGVIFVLSLHPTTLVHTFKDHTTTVTSLAVHISSGLIFSSSLDGTVRLWDLEARRQAHRLDVRLPVHGMAIMTPSANPCRFYCRVRSTVRLYSVKSAAKEHLASLSPMSILQRVLLPNAPTTQYQDPILGCQDGTSPPPVNLLSKATRSRKDKKTPAPVDDDASDSLQAQWVVAAGMDKTIRLFAGRAPHEAPSFTWIPEENALDLTGFALHPVRRRLFLLLESQKILVVRATSTTKDDEPDERRVDRVIDVNAVPTTGLASLSAPKRLSLDDISTVASPLPPPSTASNPASNPLIRGAVMSICCCFYPPLFRAAGSHASDDDARHIKWFSRTFVHRRQQSRRDLKRVDELATGDRSARTATSPASTPTLVQSEREWIVCGSEYGHLVFWHTGLTNSFHEAISLDAHDAAVLAIAASASSPLLVSLDATKRVQVWLLQPAFTLRHVVELNEQPTCFALSPYSELVLSGYEDGAVVLLNVSAASHRVETFTSEENHFAMVSAGDFLDAKAIVVTASVDAVIKVWDQQKTLLRQLQIAMAVTSLCFMNDHGDMMAGVATGIVVLSRSDVLPDKLPATWEPAAASSPSSTQETTATATTTIAAITTSRPIWLSPEKNEADALQTPPSPQEKDVEKASTGSSLLARTTSVRFQLPDNDDSPEKSDSVSAAERVECAAELTARPTDDSTPRRPKALTLSPLDRSVVPVALLSPPVLRNRRRIDLPSPAFSSPTNQSQSQSRPSSNETAPERPDPDWREIVMPLAPYQKLSQRMSSLRSSSRQHRHRRHFHRADSTPTARKELQSLGAERTASPPTVDASPRPVRPPSSPRAEPNALAIGVPDDELGPLQYCKHQAPVPPKAKTPRKLWNAIGGEDRRLLAVQRTVLPFLPQ